MGLSRRRRWRRFSRRKWRPFSPPPTWTPRREPSWQAATTEEGPNECRSEAPVDRAPSTSGNRLLESIASKPSSPAAWEHAKIPAGSSRIPLVQIAFRSIGVRIHRICCSPYPSISIWLTHARSPRPACAPHVHTPRRARSQTPHCLRGGTRAVRCGCEMTGAYTSTRLSVSCTSSDRAPFRVAEVSGAGGFRVAAASADCAAARVARAITRIIGSDSGWACWPIHRSQLVSANAT
jgi:hypothetical protein